MTTDKSVKDQEISAPYFGIEMMMSVIKNAKEIKSDLLFKKLENVEINHYKSINMQTECNL